MKKTTKFISILLSLMLAVSSFAGAAVFPAAAEENEEQLIYFQYPDESVWTHEGLKINARTGLANVYCYAYAIYGNSKPYSLGWKTRPSQCKAVAQDGKALIDSTLFSFDLAGVVKTVDGVKTPLGPIEEGADYGVIFSTSAAGQNQTCDLTMSTECIGDTVIVTPYNGEATRVNAADSMKVDHYAAWKNTEGYGPKAVITSIGMCTPGIFPKHQPKAQILSEKLKIYLTNPINNTYFQYDNNMELCDALGVTPQEVYDQYVEDYSEYFIGEPETDSYVPCPFYRYMYENDQDRTVEGKLAAPEYVKEVLGVTDDEPETEPHNHSEVTDKGYPATCTEDGLTDGTHCSVCGEVLTAQEVIPATGHNYIDVPGVPATVTSTGLTDGVKCENCGEWLVKPQIIPAVKQGVIDGVYYENGEAKNVGVVKCGNDYYCTTSGGKLVYGDKVIFSNRANGLLLPGTYHFDEETGKLRKDNVIIDDVYYKEGKPANAGIVKVGESYYLTTTKGVIVKNVEKKYIASSRTNGLVPIGYYDFGADGKMTVKNGIINGKYYKDGKAVNVGLFEYEINGVTSVYCTTTGGAILKNVTNKYIAASRTNGIAKAGYYSFDADGKMIQNYN